jgi:hypothetical protein
VMSRSSISWQIDRLGGSSSPPLPITPSPPEWRALAGSTVGVHRRSEPHQERVPARSPRRGTPSHVDASGCSEQLQPLQVIGGELDPSEIVGDGPRAGCGSCHGLGGCSWSSPLCRHAQRRDDDPMPTTGRTSRWAEVGGTGAWSVSSRKRARTTSASRVPWDAVRPIMVRQRGRVITQRG